LIDGPSTVPWTAAFVAAESANTAEPRVEHTITDFIARLDKIDLRQFSAITAANLPTETQQGADTLITLDSNDTLLLKNVASSHVHASDFILHA
jgi:hypothetical protein